MFKRSAKPSDATPRALNIYMSLARERVLVVAMHQNLAGIYYEQDDPVVLGTWPEPVELGKAFRAAFDRFSVVDADLRSRKLTDWPAFRASGEGSVGAFKARYVTLSCLALNASNSTVRAGTVHPTEHDVELSVTVNPLQDPQDIGSQLLKLFEIVSACAPTTSVVRRS
jgi:hypothetical protein